MISMRPFVLFVVLGPFICSVAAGQEIDDATSGVRYGVHAGPSLTTLGVGASGGLSVESNRHVFSLRAASTDPAFGGETWDVALLYGRAFFVRTFVLSGGTGVAVVGGTRYGHLFGRGAGSKLEPIIGFPLEGRLSWVPMGFVAVEVYGFANVNTGQPFGGLGVGVRIGNVR